RIFSKRRLPREGSQPTSLCGSRASLIVSSSSSRAVQGLSPEHKPNKLLVLRQRRFWLPTVRGSDYTDHGCFSSQSFWKAGAPRKGSHIGSNLRSAGVIGIP